MCFVLDFIANFTGFHCDFIVDFIVDFTVCHPDSLFVTEWGLGSWNERPVTIEAKYLIYYWCIAVVEVVSPLKRLSSPFSWPPVPPASRRFVHYSCWFVCKSHSVNSIKQWFFFYWLWNINIMKSFWLATNNKGVLHMQRNSQFTKSTSYINVLSLFVKGLILRNCIKFI